MSTFLYLPFYSFKKNSDIMFINTIKAEKWKIITIKN